MLVRITDSRGKDRYINPMYVKGLLGKGAHATEIEITGWSTKLRVQVPLDEAAAMLNAAMPDGLLSGAPEVIAASEAELAQQRAQAAAAANG